MCRSPALPSTREVEAGVLYNKYLYNKYLPGKDRTTTYSIGEPIVEKVFVRLPRIGSSMTCGVQNVISGHGGHGENTVAWQGFLGKPSRILGLLGLFRVGSFVCAFGDPVLRNQYARWFQAQAA